MCFSASLLLLLTAEYITLKHNNKHIYYPKNLYNHASVALLDKINTFCYSVRKGWQKIN